MDSGVGKYCSKLFHCLCMVATIVMVSWCSIEYFLDHDFVEIKFRKFHETPDDVYPSITICDKSPFDSTPAKERYRSYIKKVPMNISGEKHIHTPSLPINVYQKFLHGDQNTLINSRRLHPNHTEEELLLGLQEIDYDEVTTGLRDIISEFYITLPINSEDVRPLTYQVNSNDNLILNETDVEKWEDFIYWRKRLLKFKSITSYISTRQPYYKCYTLDVPMIEKVQIREISMTLNTSIFL